MKGQHRADWRDTEEQWQHGRSTTYHDKSENNRESCIFLKERTQGARKIEATVILWCADDSIHCNGWMREITSMSIQGGQVVRRQCRGATGRRPQSQLNEPLSLLCSPHVAARVCGCL